MKVEVVGIEEKFKETWMQCVDRDMEPLESRK